MRSVFILILLMVGMNCMAISHYVVMPGTAGVTATDPYTNWATAGTNIIDVVNAAMTNIAARIVWVTNGIYCLTNQIAITNDLTLRSVNGRDVTILDGMDRTNNRCVSGLNAAITFDGFTVTNYNYTANYGLVDMVAIGYIQNCLFVKNTTKGGCVTITAYGAIVTNCIFRNNTATLLGTGIYVANLPSSVNPILIANCLFEGNHCDGVGAIGGGAMCVIAKNTTISNCTIINNTSINNGGGIYLSGSGFGSTPPSNNLIVGCTITGNVVVGTGKGGGISGYIGASLSPRLNISDCSIIGNIATNQGGGVWGPLLTIKNCLIARNQSLTNIGGGIWMTTGIVESCTIVSNYAAVSGGGLYIASLGCSGTNNIIYYNTAGVSAANFTNTAGNTGLNYSCVFPAVDGNGNITDDPRFIDLAGGNYRLRMSSPCVNTGTNQDWMTNAVDLEGNARILNNIVDMGAYETILWQGTIYKIP